MKKGEKRRKELLEIAYRMFLSKGYENTSVDSIIEEAGIAKVFRLEFTVESEEDTRRILKFYEDGAKGDAPGCLKQYTNGHLFRGAM